MVLVDGDQKITGAQPFGLDIDPISISIAIPFVHEKGAFLALEGDKYSRRATFHTGRKGFVVDHPDNHGFPTKVRPPSLSI